MQWSFLSAIVGHIKDDLKYRITFSFNVILFSKLKKNTIKKCYLAGPLNFGKLISTLNY